jgi:hypothetical protein
MAKQRIADKLKYTFPFLNSRQKLQLIRMLLQEKEIEQNKLNNKKTNNKMKKLLLSIAVLLFSLTSFSQDWVKLGESKAGQKWEYKLNAYDNSIYGVWAKLYYQKKVVNGSNSYPKGHSLMYFEIDVESKQYKLIKVVKYTKPTAPPTNYTLDEAEQNWEIPTPDSMIEELVEAVYNFHQNL